MSDRINVRRRTVLSIAGSDSGGGAGIQADLKTFHSFGLFGTSVLTAVTAQNLDGVRAIQPVSQDVVAQQLLAVLEGFPVKAIKTGMLHSRNIIKEVTSILQLHRGIPLVIDPVFISTSGTRLIEETADQALIRELFPLGTLITPNIPEAEVLIKEKIATAEDQLEAALKLESTYRVPVLLKGGHLADSARDVLVESGHPTVFNSEKITAVNSHGSGCTLSAAICACLALGKDLNQAVAEAKNYIIESLTHFIELSQGTRVLNHFRRDSDG